MAERNREELIDLNEGTVDDFLSIEGISVRAAEAIVAFREQHGGFRMMEELERLPQLSADGFLILQDAVQLTAGEERYATRRLEKPDLTTEPGGRGM